MIDTAKVTDRRELKFSCQNCIVNDIDKLVASGEVTSIGNWPPGKIVQHIADQINMSIDGFPKRAPLPIRLGGKMMFKKILSGGMKPGINLPPDFEAMLPPEDTPFADAVENLHKAAGRLENEQMNAEHPVFGKLSHGDWMKLHCRHAEMHFSFLKPAGDASG